MYNNASLKLKLPKIEGDVNNNDPFMLKKDFQSPKLTPRHCESNERDGGTFSFPAIGLDGAQQRHPSSSAKRHSFVSSQLRCDSGFQDGHQQQQQQQQSARIMQRGRIASSQSSTPKETANGFFTRLAVDEKDAKEHLTSAENFFHYNNNNVTSNITTKRYVEEKNENSLDNRNSQVRQKLLQFQEKRVKHSNLYEKIEESRAKRYRHRLQKQESFDIHTAVESNSLKKCNDWLNAWFTIDGMPRNLSPDPNTEDAY
eukprot:gene7925-8780_t